MPSPMPICMPWSNTRIEVAGEGCAHDAGDGGVWVFLGDDAGAWWVQPLVQPATVAHAAEGQKGYRAVTHTHVHTLILDMDREVGGGGWEVSRRRGSEVKRTVPYNVPASALL